MMHMGYPLHLIDLLAKLYRKQLAKVKVAGTLSEWFRVKKGSSPVRLCSSPYLFNILAEMVIRETLDVLQGGLQISGADPGVSKVSVGHRIKGAGVRTPDTRPFDTVPFFEKNIFKTGADLTDFGLLDGQSSPKWEIPCPGRP